MARDSGRYDAFTDTWISDNVQIDFVWGNAPTQPNDDRGQNVLDPILDSHEIVYNTWNGFPAYVPNTTDGGGSGSGSGSGSVATTGIVPDVAGLTESAALATLAGLGFTSVITTFENTANEGLDGLVLGTMPFAGESYAFADTMFLIVGQYVATDIIPATTNWGYQVGNGMMGPFDYFYLGSGYNSLEEAPVELVNSPTSYSLVFSGADGWGTNGTYAITGVTMPEPGFGTGLKLTLAMQSVDSTPAYKTGATYDGESLGGSSPAAGTFAVTATSAVVDILSPTTDWQNNGSNNNVQLGKMRKAPDALTASPSSYKLVVTGGSYAGEYAITNVFYTTGNTYITTATHFGASMSGSKGSTWSGGMSMGNTDGGTVQIVHV